MTTDTPPIIVPAEHPIAIATRRATVAQGCLRVLTEAGYPTVACPVGSPGTAVVEMVEAHRPHLLIIDDDIEWSEGIHVVQRLRVEPIFASMWVILLLPLSNDVPQWGWQDGSWSHCTIPFTPAELLHFAYKSMELLVREERLPFPEPSPQSGRTEAEWEAWRQEAYSSALIDAVIRGDWARIEALIALGADIRFQTARGTTALSVAASTGREDTLLFLLAKGAEVNTVNEHGISPLWLAAERAHLNAMRLLLQRGADPNAASVSGEPPLMRLFPLGRSLATPEWRSACVRLLMEYGADPTMATAEGDSVFTRTQERSLILGEAGRLLCTEPSQSPADYRIVVAMRQPKQALQCAQHLMQAGYSVVLCSEEVNADRVIATVATHQPDLLLCDDDIELQEGAHVVLRLHADPAFAMLSVLLLPDRSTEIPQWTWHDTWPITQYLTKPFSPTELLGVVRRLHRYHLEHDDAAIPPRPPHRTMPEWQEWTEALPPFPFFTAVERGHQAEVEQWIAQGVDVDASNRRGWTALHNAAYRGHVEIALLLLQSGATVEVSTITGATPLWYAARHVHIEVMRLLLEHGADPNALRLDRQTILVSVTGRGGSDYTRNRRTEGAKLLLEHGADPHRADPNSDTPLSCATKYAMVEVESLLRNSGRVFPEKVE